MAKNAPIGDGQRKGMVTGRSQTFNPVTNRWVKRNAETGKFMDVKQDGSPFKGVRKEKSWLRKYVFNIYTMANYDWK